MHVRRDSLAAAAGATVCPWRQDAICGADGREGQKESGRTAIARQRCGGAAAGPPPGGPDQHDGQYNGRNPQGYARHGARARPPDAMGQQPCRRDFPCRLDAGTPVGRPGGSGRIDADGTVLDRDDAGPAARRPPDPGRPPVRRHGGHQQHDQNRGARPPDRRPPAPGWPGVVEGQHGEHRTTATNNSPRPAAMDRRGHGEEAKATPASWPAGTHRRRISSGSRASRPRAVGSGTLSMLKLNGSPISPPTAPSHRTLMPSGTTAWAKG